MLLQSFVLPLVFLLSKVSGLKNEQPINYIHAHAHMDVNCNGSPYTGSDLDTAAFEACSRTSKKNFCRDYISPYYLKKCIPAIPKASIYKGPYYRDQITHGLLLMWPLPTRSWHERTKNHAIIYWNAFSRECKAVGAIHQTSKTEHKHDQCKLKIYNVATNEQFVRSSTQREKSFRYSQTNPTEMSLGGNQNEIPLPSQPSDAQPKLKPERHSFAKIQQSIRKFFRKPPVNSNKIDPTDSETKNGPEH